jgi:hypothetical protein
MRSAIFVLMLALIVEGCSLMRGSPEPSPFSGFPAVAEGTSEIVIYRSEYVDVSRAVLLLTVPEVKINEQSIGKLRERAYLRVVVPPGPYQITGNPRLYANFPGSADFVAERSQRYFVELRMELPVPSLAQPRFFRRNEDDRRKGNQRVVLREESSLTSNRSE